MIRLTRRRSPHDLDEEERTTLAIMPRHVLYPDFLQGMHQSLGFSVPLGLFVGALCGFLYCRLTLPGRGKPKCLVPRTAPALGGWDQEMDDGLDAGYPKSLGE
jgi:hypothetical protein